MDISGPEVNAWRQALGKRVAAARRDRRMSRAQLAEAAGLSPSQLVRIEQAKGSTSPEAIAGLCRALSVSADLLLGLVPSENEAVDELSLLVAMRCAACGRGFSVPARHLRNHLTVLLRKPKAPTALVALTCSDCGSGGKSEHDGCLVHVRLTRADRPRKGPATWEPKKAGR